MNKIITIQPQGEKGVRIFLSGHDSAVLHIAGKIDDVVDAINKGKVFLVYESKKWDFKTNTLKEGANLTYINPFGIRYFYDDSVSHFKPTITI